MNKDIEKKLTPLMQQYYSVKKQHKDIILFFRLGDFYEMFDEDAKYVSNVLNITLTARNNVPMCGIPHHSAQTYIDRLIKSGHKIAICEQLEEAGKDKKIVRRDVVRVITPGTLVEENLLDDKSNNYLMCITPDMNELSIGLTVIDISTGEFRGSLIEGQSVINSLKVELTKYNPKEVVVPIEYSNDKNLLGIFFERNITVSFISKEDFFEQNIDTKILLSIINRNSVHKLIYKSAIGIINYVSQNYKDVLTQLCPIGIYNSTDFMQLNENTVKHLELIENFYNKERKNSLLDTLDLTMTPMGSRMLKKWLLEPLLDINRINRRQEMVKFFFENNSLRENLRTELKKVKDIERIVNRINCNANSVRDIVFLKKVLELIPNIKQIISDTKAEVLINEDIKNKMLIGIIDGLGELNDIKELIDKSVDDDAPNNIKDGGVIKNGFSKELDDLRNLKFNGKSWLFEYEKTQKERTGITTLKVKFNNIFGYYIEVSKSYLKSVPSDFIRVQTVANGERYTTETLKEYEIGILKAESDILRLENDLYNAIRDTIKTKIEALHKMTHNLTLLDMFSNFAELAVKYNYVRPVIDDGYDLIIKEGRHPVVERLASDNNFVPNDTEFIENKCHLYLITGPNMAGKSTYIRQVSLLVIMAQIGSFIPASSAKIGIVDKIYTRIGSGDKLVKGESTFMVEMKETADIIKGSSSRSLVILDEVGRGTSTFDGISLAWVIVKELVDRAWYNETFKVKRSGPRTWFATHYFELVELANILSAVKNFSMAVREWNDEVVFMHKIVEGVSDKSYGLHVAKIAGVPISLIEHAKTKLKELETTDNKRVREEKSDYDVKTFFSDDNFVLDEIKKINSDELSPVGALLKIKEWNERLKD
jgi:DNA mismatch repair protein MutS